MAKFNKMPTAYGKKQFYSKAQSDPDRIRAKRRKKKPALHGSLRADRLCGVCAYA